MPQLSHSRGDVKMELTVPNAGKDVEQQEKECVARETAKWHSHFGRRFGSHLKN